MNVLVTGGAGYIGSHTCVELIKSGFNPVIIDNFLNSKISVIDRIKKISSKRVDYYRGDINDINLLSEIIKKHSIEAVIHFAGLKSVSDSIHLPLSYYCNNINGTLNLLRAMELNAVDKLIFSSSATVYGNVNANPVKENAELSPLNPYGRTKFFIEEILKDVAFKNPSLSIAILRYFNPVGANSSGLIGEDPIDIPNNLMPILGKVASGELPFLKVFGNDYPTIDGTGVRDFIHVTDLARGHSAALSFISSQNGVEIFNLGTGRGVSVLQLISAYEEVSGIEVPYHIVEKRKGDISISYADVSKASALLKWQAEYDLYDMCRDSWNWISKNYHKSSN